MKFEIIHTNDSAVPFVLSSMVTEDDENYSIKLCDTFNKVCERVYPNKPNDKPVRYKFSINSIEFKKVHFHGKDVYRFYIEGSNNQHYVIKNNICGFIYFCKVNLKRILWHGSVLFKVLFCH